MRTSRADLLRWSGPLAAVVALGGVVLATLVSPAFRWTENALSNLGVATTDAGTPLTAALFGGGLVAGGLLGLGFAAWLWQSAQGAGDRAVAVLTGGTVVAMAGIGLFPQGETLHLPVAVVFYLLVSVLLWSDGVVSYADGLRQRGIGAALLGTANLGAWVGWSATGSFGRPGSALPEAVGALALATWVAAVALVAGD